MNGYYSKSFQLRGNIGITSELLPTLFQLTVGLLYIYKDNCQRKEVYPLMKKRKIVPLNTGLNVT